MQTPVTPRSVAMLIAILSTSLAVWGCSKSEKGDSSSAYQAACEGPPLHTTAARNKAVEDGYAINRSYDCIDKASFAAIKEQRDKWEAANTPEAKAQRVAERAKRIAEEQARKSATDESQGPVFQKPSTASSQLVRCTSADGKSSTLHRGQCAAGETPTLATPNAPLMERSDTNTALIKCTSRDGKKESIQRGNCASADDYQQRLGDY